MSVRVNLTLKDDFVEELDFVSKQRFGDVPRSTLVTLLARRALDEELNKIDHVRCVDGIKTIEQIERDVLIV